MKIPDEAVEAAKKAIEAEFNYEENAGYMARLALEAALPYLSEAARHQRRSPTDWPDIPKAKS